MNLYSDESGTVALGCAQTAPGRFRDDVQLVDQLWPCRPIVVLEGSNISKHPVGDAGLFQEENDLLHRIGFWTVGRPPRRSQVAGNDKVSQPMPTRAPSATSRCAHLTRRPSRSPPNARPSTPCSRSPPRGRPCWHQTPRTWCPTAGRTRSDGHARCGEATCHSDKPMSSCSPRRPNGGVLPARSMPPQPAPIAAGRRGSH